MQAIGLIDQVMPDLVLGYGSHYLTRRGTCFAGQDDLEDDMGFRTVEVRGTQILLNGSPIFLRGVSVHAEAPYRTGRACNDETSELVRQVFFRFYSHVYSRFRGVCQAVVWA
jgi:hypothetical protein